MRLLSLLMAIACSTTFLTFAPAASACTWVPPEVPDCVPVEDIPPCLGDCTFNDARWNFYEPECALADLTCSDPPGWLTVVVAFAAHKWVDPPQATCSASVEPLWVQNGVGGCAVAVRVHTADPCLPITFHVTGVGTFTGHTASDSTWTCELPGGTAA